jgi:WhiB family transcriptional regulator, redox-sensing transcriptional regulator
VKPLEWMTEAACSGHENAGWWFSTDLRDQRKAARVCFQCPVVDQCGSYALRAGILDGVWGGLIEAELYRAAQRRIRP